MFISSENIEVEIYRNERYISANETVWRLVCHFSYYWSTTVIASPVHEKNNWCKLLRLCSWWCTWNRRKILYLKDISNCVRKSPSTPSLLRWCTTHAQMEWKEPWVDSTTTKSWWCCTYKSVILSDKASVAIRLGIFDRSGCTSFQNLRTVTGTITKHLTVVRELSTSWYTIIRIPLFLHCIDNKNISPHLKNYWVIDYETNNARCTCILILKS